MMMKVQKALSILRDNLPFLHDWDDELTEAMKTIYAKCKCSMYPRIRKNTAQTKLDCVGIPLKSEQGKASSTLWTKGVS